MDTGAIIALILSTIGGGISAYLGGWDTALEFLLVFMLLDIFTGVLTSTVFGRSKHTRSGHFASKTFLKGIVSKMGVLCLVVVAVGIDALLGIDYVRDTVVIFFCFNEIMSITENAQCMGLPIPKVISKTLEVYYSSFNDDDEEKPKIK